MHIFNKNPQRGRTMLEMLMALLILGMISVGGYAGVRYALGLSQAWRAQSQVNQLAKDVMALYAWQDSYATLSMRGTRGICNTIVSPGNQDCVILSPWNEQVRVEKGNSNASFKIVMEKTPKSICNHLQDMRFENVYLIQRNCTGGVQEMEFLMDKDDRSCPEGCPVGYDCINGQCRAQDREDACKDVHCVGECLTGTCRGGACIREQDGKPCSIGSCRGGECIEDTLEETVTEPPIDDGCTRASPLFDGSKCWSCTEPNGIPSVMDSCTRVCPNRIVNGSGYCMLPTCPAGQVHDCYGICHACNDPQPWDVCFSKEEYDCDTVCGRYFDNSGHGICYLDRITTTTPWETTTTTPWETTTTPWNTTTTPWETTSDEWETTTTDSDCRRIYPKFSNVCLSDSTLTYSAASQYCADKGMERLTPAEAYVLGDSYKNYTYAWISGGYVYMGSSTSVYTSTSGNYRSLCKDYGTTLEYDTLCTTSYDCASDEMCVADGTGQKYCAKATCSNAQDVCFGNLYVNSSEASLFCDRAGKRIATKDEWTYSKATTGGAMFVLNGSVAQPWYKSTTSGMSHYSWVTSARVVCLGINQVIEKPVDDCQTNSDCDSGHWCRANWQDVKKCEKLTCSTSGGICSGNLSISSSEASTFCAALGYRLATKAEIAAASMNWGGPGWVNNGGATQAWYKCCSNTSTPTHYSWTTSAPARCK